MNDSTLKNSAPSVLKTALLTVIAMFAFAGNSLLCRLALAQGLIDAASFTSVRLISGAVFLALIVLPSRRSSYRVDVEWRTVLMLFAYMACFSFSYLSLSAGTGALILFGSVQVTMIIVALRGGEKATWLTWLGFALAVLGLVWLVLPGVTAPDPMAALLMMVAGVAWGFYTLLGKGSNNPLVSTANNFLYAVPIALVLSLLFLSDTYTSPGGLTIAIASGVITSGLGYVAWYAALRGLTATRAATVQLTVPAIAAFGGVVWLGEPVTIRLLLASLITLGGVWIVLSQRAVKLKRTKITS